MAVTNTVATLNGFFKETYADKLGELIPDGVKVLNKIKFMAKDKQPGNLYHTPVILGMEHGVTFASSDDDAFNLNPAVAGVVKDAQVKGSPAVMRSLLGYVAASRAAQGNQKAFMDATKFLVSNMLRSMARKLEIQMLHGQMGYGAITNAAAGTPTLVIADAEWAPGIWAGSEGLTIEIRSADGLTSRGEVVVQSVNMSTKTLTLTANAPTGSAATDILWHKGTYGVEAPGIHKILTTTSGTMFNINVGTYSLFRGNQYDAAGGLTFEKVNSASARAVEKGLDGSLLALVNPRTWAKMLNDQAALRKFDSTYSSAKGEMGAKSIVFHSQNGEIEIEPSIYVKEGYAYLLDMATWSRVGSSDMTFKRPGQGDDFFRDVDGSAAYELRLFSDQALFCNRPGTNVVISGIVNS